MNLSSKLKKWIRLLCPLLAAVVLLTGCGLPGQDGDVSELSEPAETPEPTEPPRQAIDWSSHQVVAAQQTADGPAWNIVDYFDGWIKYPAKYDWKHSEYIGGTDGDFCAKTQYAVYNEDGSASDLWYSLDYFDMETGDSLHGEMDYDSWGISAYASLNRVDVAGDKLLACYFCTSEEEGTPRSYCSLVLYHMEDGVQKTLDLLPALEAADAASHRELYYPPDVLYDREGCCYIVLEDQILIIGEDGQLLSAAEPGEDAGSLTYLCKTPEGLPVFVSMNLKGRKNTYWGYDHDGGQLRSLGESGYISLDYGCVDPGGYLYHFSQGKIIRWDTLTGAHENIFDCQANNICSNTAAEKLMAIREDGSLILMDSMTETDSIYVLSTTPLEEKTLTLVSACYGTQMIQNAASLFSIKKPGVSIAFTSISEEDDWETYNTNLMNRVIAGDAPDMFIIPAEKMQIFYEKGVLADLSDVFSQELREQVFDCVWNAGTIDGKLVGLTTAISTRTMLVSEDIWPQNTWTLENMLTLADTTQSGKLKGLIPMESGNPSASALLYDIALRDISSSLVDWDTKTCHFDSQTFRRLLEYCKDTPLPQDGLDYQSRCAAIAREVQEGEYLAYSCGTYSLGDFSQQMASFPEGYHCVGVPTDRGSGNIAYASYFLVVNKNSENMDLIREFLPTLYGEEIERKYPEYCLRRDVLRSRVVIPEWDNQPQFNMGEGVYQLLPAKPDGSSYVEEYIAYMDSCILYPTMDSTIADIVWEEAEPYFAGDKDLDQVIDNIQKRVQLYLYEIGS